MVERLIYFRRITDDDIRIITTNLIRDYEKMKTKFFDLDKEMDRAIKKRDLIRVVLWSNLHGYLLGIFEFLVSLGVFNGDEFDEIEEAFEKKYKKIWKTLWR